MRLCSGGRGALLPGSSHKGAKRGRRGLRYWIVNLALLQDPWTAADGAYYTSGHLSGYVGETGYTLEANRGSSPEPFPSPSVAVRCAVRFKFATNFLSQVGRSLSTTAKEPESAAPCFTKMYASVLSRPSESALAAVILP